MAITENPAKEKEFGSSLPKNGRHPRFLCKR